MAVSRTNRSGTVSATNIQGGGGLRPLHDKISLSADISMHLYSRQAIHITKQDDEDVAQHEVHNCVYFVSQRKYI